MKVLKYIGSGVRDPLAALHYLLYGRRKLAEFQVKRLAKALGYQEDVDKYYKLIRSHTDFYTNISKALGETYFGELKDAEAEHLYVMVRILNPATVVETGVAAGVSSAFILKALHDNNRGTLYSIDFPRYDQEYIPNGVLLKVSPLPPGKGPGFVIPQDIKERWVLKIGKSKDILPIFLNEINKVDIFFHDSQHSYENMMFEYATVWDYLPKGGLLLSHDLDWNTAFKDFAQRTKRKAVRIYFTEIGVIVK